MGPPGFFARGGSAQENCESGNSSAAPAAAPKDAARRNPRRERSIGSSFESANTLADFVHQIRHAFSRTMGWPFLQPKASQNSGMFETTLFTRYLRYECGLVKTCVRIASCRACPAQAKP